MMALADIKSLEGQLESRRSGLAGDEALMAAYDRELAEYVAGLRSRHNYDDLSKRISDGRTGIDGLSRRLLMERCFFVLRSVGAMLRADESVAAETAVMLKGAWNLDILVDSNVREDTYASAFTVYIADVCRPEWWDEHDPQVQPNGYVCVNQHPAHGWFPRFDVCIPAGVLDDLDGFAEFARKETVRLADQWANRWMERTECDPEKRAALLARLRTGDADPA